jgi:hypothetical protein
MYALLLDGCIVTVPVTKAPLSKSANYKRSKKLNASLITYNFLKWCLNIYTHYMKYLPSAILLVVWAHV